MDTKVLIIGAGHAGIETAASLRNFGFSGKIEIFDQENTLPYQKPPSQSHTSNHLIQKKLFLEVRNGMLITKLI